MVTITQIHISSLHNSEFPSNIASEMNHQGKWIIVKRRSLSFFIGTINHRAPATNGGLSSSTATNHCIKADVMRILEAREIDKVVFSAHLLISFVGWETGVLFYRQGTPLWLGFSTILASISGANNIYGMSACMQMTLRGTCTCQWVVGQRCTDWPSLVSVACRASVGIIFIWTKLAQDVLPERAS